jgi:uncharacterized protein (DUF697 family)
MPGIKDVANLWDNVREIDLRPLRDAALRGVRIAIVGQEETGRYALADQMRHDPAQPQAETDSPLLILDLEEARASAERLYTTDLIILSLHALSENDSRERLLAKDWADAGKKVLVVITRVEAGNAPGRASVSSMNRTFGISLDYWLNLGDCRVVIGRLDDPDFLSRDFVPAVLELLPQDNLALGRQFPLFRVPVAHQLINETCFSNAVYSLSTGLAEVVPVLGLPLNVADMVVLTKSQAFLVYKLGLALGLSTRWQDYVNEFGGVLGGGFLWRQVARSLVGLIPAWGVIPKVAVAYSGTYVVGHAVLRWYLTGRHVSKDQLSLLYGEAFERGKLVARNLRERMPQLHLKSRLPRPRLPGRRKAPAALPAGDPGAQAAPAVSGPQISLPGVADPDGRRCPVCGKDSAADASFCQYCGAALNGHLP